jgi:hypothetical protein
MGFMENAFNKPPQPVKKEEEKGNGKIKTAAALGVAAAILAPNVADAANPAIERLKQKRAEKIYSQLGKSAEYKAAMEKKATDSGILKPGEKITFDRASDESPTPVSGPEKVPMDRWGK